MARQPDHEFDWIENDMDNLSIHCTRCGAETHLDNWLDFIAKHSLCKEKEDEQVST